MQIGILASGSLGHKVLRALCDCYDISYLFTDSGSEELIQFAIENNIPFFKGNPRDGKAQQFLNENSCDVLISINYLFLIEPDLINHPNILAFNVHGSLLPKYRGRTPHVWSIINNEKKTGITAHLIDEYCDTGDIIEQIVVPIDVNDTGNIILKKYSELYFPLIVSVIDQIESNNLNYLIQNNENATYYGKRTPDDGLINWDWQKERINNWVRAQANPYPGAFTFYEGKKIIIDQIKYSDLGYFADESNGTILKSKPLTIKTNNGAVEIVSYRNDLISFLEGKKLSNEN